MEPKTDVTKYFQDNGSELIRDRCELTCFKWDNIQLRIIDYKYSNLNLILIK